MADVELAGTAAAGASSSADLRNGTRNLASSALATARSSAKLRGTFGIQARAAARAFGSGAMQLVTPLNTSDEPGHASFPLDRSQWLRGVQNGDFSQPPPDPSKPINSDPTSAGYNELPGWRLVRVQGTSGDFYWVDATPPYIEARSTAAINDDSDLYLEQNAPVPADVAGAFVHLFRAQYLFVSYSGAASTRSYLQAQFIDRTGAAIGTADNDGLGVVSREMGTAPNGGNLPADAVGVNLRIGASHALGTVAFVGRFYGVWRVTGQRSLPIAAAYGDTGYADIIRQPGGALQLPGGLYVPGVVNANAFAFGQILADEIDTDPGTYVPASPDYELIYLTCGGLGTTRVIDAIDGAAAGATLKIIVDPTALSLTLTNMSGVGGARDISCPNAADLVIPPGGAVELINDGSVAWNVTAIAADYLTSAAALAAYQPLDSDLTAIAALSTTSFGRSLLTLANAAALRTSAGLVIGTDVQAYDAELAALAGLTSAASSFPYFTGSGTAALLVVVSAIRTLLASADVATFRTNAGLAIGTDVEAHDADLTTFAGLTPTNDDVLQRKGGAWANRTIAQLLVDLAAAGTTFQPLDSDLTAIAALATTSFGRSVLTQADAAALRTLAGLGTVATLASDTDGTLAANSDTKVATQKATKTYVDAAVTGLLEFKGTTDCSANPNYPAANKGDAYVVSVAGKIGGASGKTVAIGDWYVAEADNAGGTEASVGTSWTAFEHNIADLATVATTGSASDLGSGTLPAGRMPAMTGDAASSVGTVGLTIAARAVSYAKMQAVSATSRILGRKTAAAGDIEELTAADVKTMLAIASTDVSGLATIATSGSASDLGSGTLPAGRFPALTGDVTTVAGALAATLANAGPGATGPIGSTSVAPVITIDAKGRVTGLTSATHTPAAIGASANPHGAADHTDITRFLWLGADTAVLDGGAAATIGSVPNALKVVSLADAATQGCYWAIPIPADWASGSITVQPFWVPGATDASSHAVRWQTTVKSVTVAGGDPTAAGTAVVWTGQAIGHVANLIYGNGEPQTDTTVTPTTVNEVLMVNLRRIGADAADTYVGVANLVGLRLRYTANQ